MRTNPKPVEKTWTLADHLCKGCGGRVLACATGQGMTPGGNRLYRCAQCGDGGTEMGPGGGVCWCFFSHRGNHDTAYRCLPFSILEETPELREAFMACGCDPKSGEVGIVLEADFRRLRRVPR
jgi:hypothetical protein